MRYEKGEYTFEISTTDERDLAILEEISALAKIWSDLKENNYLILAEDFQPLLTVLLQ